MRSAEEIAEELVGTAKCLNDVVSPEEANDASLMDDVQCLVVECETCNWWVDADDVDEEGDCLECQDDGLA